ncbi:MAG: hypothetical protein CMJ40_01675 [Phycisphaerae bacterium]|nr:hypothetical protein [Phycisphaerae bacterium]
MNKTWTVAWREFRHTVFTKAFVIGVVIAPLCFGAIVILASIFLQPEAKPLVGTIAVISPDDAITEPLRESLQPEKPSSLPDIKGLSAEEATDVLLSEASASSASQVAVTKMDIDIVSMQASRIDEIKKGIRDGSYTALVVVDEEALDLDGEVNGNRVRIYVSPDSPPSHTELLESSSRNALVEARLSSQGLDPGLVQRLTARPRVTTVRLVEGGDEKTEIGDLRRFLPMAFMMLVWITTFISGNYLLTSTIEEKSNRVMEVLLSAVSPMELMSGKILGYAMVTVIMVAMFSTVLIAFLILVSVLDLITPLHIVLLLIYLVMAYMMIAAIMAGIGSAVSDLRDAQTLLGPVSFAVMIPLFLMTIIAEEPNGTVALVTTYIPPLTPFMMILRILATEPINPMEIAFSIAWGFTCAVAMIWIASRIFRIGVLMQGKPPNPIEMFRWIGYR